MVGTNTEMAGPLKTLLNVNGRDQVPISWLSVSASETKKLAVLKETCYSIGSETQRRSRARIDSFFGRMR